MSDVEIRQQRGTFEARPKAFAAWRTEHLHWSQKTAALMASRTRTAKTAGITISPSTIAMIETGDRQPSLLVVEAIAEAYGVDPEVLGKKLVNIEAVA